MLPALQKKYGYVEVISKKPHACVFEGNPHISKLSALGDDDIPKGEGFTEWKRHRANEYAFFQDLSHTCEMRLALTYHQSWFWRSAEWRRAFCGKSYIREVADVCGVDVEDCRPGFFPTADEVAAAQETKAEAVGKLGSKCCAWIISGSRFDKIYPFAAIVINRIIRDLGLPVIAFGCPGKDMEIARSIEANLKVQGNRALEGFKIAISESWSNENWDIRRLLTQVQQCDLVISPDTGPGWSVAAEPMPKIMLLSHASAENITSIGWVNTVALHADNTRVDCHPCHRLHDDVSTCRQNEFQSGAACISDINPEVVFAAAVAAMRPKPLELMEAAGE